MAAEVDAAAKALLTVWETARESTTSRVSGAQLRVVMVVEQHDGINLRRLANRLGMLLSSASRLCDRLVAAGMLEREPGRLDRREIALHLTVESRRLLTELREHRRRRLTEILAGMSPEGREALLRGLREFDEAARRQDESIPYAEPPGPWPLGDVEPPPAEWTADEPPAARTA
ncbi:MarR family winged helix-turn-helix transcriptional regulator [Micromonospora sp. WMMD558]|uniref:MarR family winged helix-turn-helix transcriptional regulator n=1 Tax=unclassified Micromonospora TaxID=2617518 RepID=UPI0012B48795|nr:MarR family winged helix-turn-helix transcriptional regulator [Micromonospora sp. WMMC415]QGN47164.1 MarR family transcriptional regulator [Micromonospora sp. WMMC415]